jgi:hypothetical protein
MENGTGGWKTGRVQLTTLGGWHRPGGAIAYCWVGISFSPANYSAGTATFTAMAAATFSLPWYSGGGQGRGGGPVPRLARIDREASLKPPSLTLPRRTRGGDLSARTRRVEQASRPWIPTVPARWAGRLCYLEASSICPHARLLHSDFEGIALEEDTIVGRTFARGDVPVGRMWRSVDFTFWDVGRGGGGG